MTCLVLSLGILQAKLKLQTVVELDDVKQLFSTLITLVKRVYKVNLIAKKSS